MKGVFEHVIYHDKYVESDLFYDHTWIVAALLNAFGIYAPVRSYSNGVSRLQSPFSLEF